MKKLLLSILLPFLLIKCELLEEAELEITHYSFIEVYRVDNGVKTELFDSSGVVDFGDVETGYSKTIAFEIRNTGDRRLELKDFNSSNDNDYGIEDISSSVIEPGKSATFNIIFIPYTRDDNPLRTTVSILSNSIENNNFKINCTGMKIPGDTIMLHEVVEKKIYLSNETTWDLGYTSLNSTLVSTYSITNFSPREIEISQIYLTDDTVYTLLDTAKYKLKTNESTQIEIYFTPKEAKIYETQLVIKNDGDINENYTVTFKGTGKLQSSAQISLKHQTLTVNNGSELPPFINTAVNSESTMMFEITNNGSATLNLESLSVIDNIDDFKIDTNYTKLNLEANEKTTFMVVFSPKTPSINNGKKKANIKLENNSGNEPEFSFLVTGYAEPEKKPQISIKVDGTKIENNLVDYNPTSLYKKHYKYFTIKNTGTKQLEISSYNILNNEDNSFILIDDSLSVIIEPNETTNFNVVFSPKNANTYNAQLKLISNSELNNVLTVDLVGQGTNNEQGSIVILGNNKVLSNNSEYSFGDVVIGYGSSMKFDIVNTGQETLYVTDLNNTNNKSSFIIDSSVPKSFTISSNEIKRITVHFKPQSVSNSYLTSQLRINSNDTSFPVFNINLKGFCIEKPQYKVYAKSYNNSLLTNNDHMGKGFYNSTYGKYVSEISIVNTGNTPLNISDINLIFTGGDYMPELNLSATSFYLLNGESTTFMVLTQSRWFSQISFNCKIIISCDNTSNFNLNYVKVEENDDGDGTGGA